MGQKRNYQPLWKLVDNLRKLTHRQASVERGFVVNMQLEVENLKEQSYVAQRLWQDHVRSVGGIHEYQFSRQAAPLVMCKCKATIHALSGSIKEKRKSRSCL